MGKEFKIVGDDISDGYHTFDELYEHRCLLFIAFVLQLNCEHLDRVYYVQDHMEGWDLLVIEQISSKEAPIQISYHVPKQFRDAYEYKVPRKNIDEHVWDGHTSSDVLDRLKIRLKVK